LRSNLEINTWNQSKRMCCFLVIEKNRHRVRKKRQTTLLFFFILFLLNERRRKKSGVKKCNFIRFDRYCTFYLSSNQTFAFLSSIKILVLKSFKSKIIRTSSLSKKNYF
jgi:hypothetical protein